MTPRKTPKIKQIVLHVVAATTAFTISTPALAAATNLRDAVAQAILQNPEVKLRYHSFLASTQEQRASEGGFLPRVDATLFGGRETKDSPTLVGSRDFTHTGASIQLRQMLFDGFATRNDVRRLGHAKLARYYELLNVTDDTALEAARAYLDVLRYRKLTELARENYITHRDLHSQLAERAAAGVGRKVDLEQAAGRLALAESNWLTDANNLHDVTARYNRLVGERPADKLADVAGLDKQLPKDKDFVSTAVRNNPGFLAAVSGIRSSRADAKVREASNLPTLELQARKSVDNNLDGVSGRTNNGALQVVLNYNLYRGGADTARIKQYAELLNAAYDLRDKSCRDVQQTIQIAWNDSLRLLDQINLLQQYELSTSKAHDAYRQQYDIGQRTLLDLLDTENELFSARRSLTSADYDLQLANIRVLAASGRLVPALNLRPLVEDVPEQVDGTSPDDDALACNPTLGKLTSLDKAGLPPINNNALKPKEAAAAPGAPAANTPVATAAKDDKAELKAVVTRWLAAWNSKNTKDYFAAYSKTFQPAQSLDIAAWKKLRSERLDKKEKYQVDIGEVAIKQLEGDKAVVEFSQRYAAPSFTDDVIKTLDLVREKDAWKISKETVVKGRTY